MTAAEYVSLMAPQYSSLDRLGGLVTLAKNTMDSGIFGDKYEYAVALMVLHWLTIETMCGGDNTNSGGVSISGAVTGYKEGDVQISYTAPTSIRREDLNATTYGRELKALQVAVSFKARTRL